MPRFDVHPYPDGASYPAPLPAGRLNPVFTVADAPHAMVTQFAAAIPRRLPDPPLASLRHEDIAIGNALDMLLTGI